MINDAMGQPADTAGIAASDQLRAQLRDIVKRVRTHRIHCPAHNVVCISDALVSDLDAMCEHCKTILLITALWELSNFQETDDG